MITALAALLEKKKKKKKKKKKTAVAPSLPPLARPLAALKSFSSLTGLLEKGRGGGGGGGGEEEKRRSLQHSTPKGGGLPSLPRSLPLFSTAAFVIVLVPTKAALFNRKSKDLYMLHGTEENEKDRSTQTPPRCSPGGAAFSIRRRRNNGKNETEGKKDEGGGEGRKQVG